MNWATERVTTCGQAAKRAWQRAPSRRRPRALTLLALLACLALPLPLAGCAPGMVGGPRYTRADADIDPYANMRRKTEELYQEGLAHERHREWRKAVQSYEQARLWDPENRQDIAVALTRTREAAGALAYAQPTPTATLQPVPPKGGTSTAPTPTEPAGPGAGAAKDRPTPAPTATVATGPKAGYRTFRSKTYPYTMDYPNDWTAKGDATGKDQEPVDMFFAPPGRTEAFIMVMAEQLRSDVTLEQYYLLMARQLEEEDEVVVHDREARTIAGHPAYVITYRLESGNRILAVRHVLFVSGGWGWGILLVATPGTTPELLKTFDSMLGSFDLQVGADTLH